MSTNRLSMPQPYKLFCDIWGVITSWDFIQQLNTYREENLKKFLSEKWSENTVQNFVFRLRVKTIEDKTSIIDLPLIECKDNKTPEDVIQSVVNNIEFRERHELKSGHKLLRELYESIWEDGYKTGQLKPYAFEDVLPTFQDWTTRDPSIKIYTFASGSPQKQKLFLKSTNCGDLSEYVINGINSFHTYKSDSEKFRHVSSALLEPNPKNILYLTDSPKKAKAAITGGLNAVVVQRPGNKIYKDELMEGLQTVQCLYDFDFYIKTSD